MAISWWKKTTSMNGVSFQTTTSVTVTTMRKTISPTNPILNTQNKATQSTRTLKCYRNSIPARCMYLRKIPLKWTVDLPRTTDFNRFESGFEKVTEGDSTENENTPSGKTSIRELSIQEICILVQSSINADEITENDASKYHANIRDTYLENSTTSTIEVFVDSLTATKTLPCYASLQEVSALFKLTNDQHRAFVIIGRALLRSFESQSFKWRSRRDKSGIPLAARPCRKREIFCDTRKESSGWIMGAPQRLYEHAHRPGKCHKE